MMKLEGALFPWRFRVVLGLLGIMVAAVSLMSTLRAVVSSVFREDYHQDGDERIHHYYVSESVGIACGILLAALNAAGLETLTHTPSPMGFLRQILDRPGNEKPYLLLPVGYPADGCRVPAIRKKTQDEVTVRK